MLLEDREEYAARTSQAHREVREAHGALVRNGVPLIRGEVGRSHIVEEVETLREGRVQSLPAFPFLLRRRTRLCTSVDPRLRISHHLPTPENPSQRNAC